MRFCTMVYTEDFTMRHYVGFSQIGSHMSCQQYAQVLMISMHNMLPWTFTILSFISMKIIMTLLRLSYKGLQNLQIAGLHYIV